MRIPSSRHPIHHNWQVCVTRVCDCRFKGRDGEDEHLSEDVCPEEEGGKVDREEGCEEVGEWVVVVRCEAVRRCYGVGV